MSRQNGREKSVWHIMASTLLTLLILNDNVEILHKMELNITLQIDNKQSIKEAFDTWLLPSSLATVNEVTIKSYILYILALSTAMFTRFSTWKSLS